MASRDLSTFRNHCARQAKKPGADPLWARLADEVDRYLGAEPAEWTDDGDRTPAPDDVPLIGA